MIIISILEYLTHGYQGIFWNGNGSLHGIKYISINYINE